MIITLNTPVKLGLLQDLLVSWLKRQLVALESSKSSLHNLLNDSLDLSDVPMP